MPRRASTMSGTSKAVVSKCVLLLAALVVYYGMTPPEESQGHLVDLPKQRPSLFGGDPEEKMIALGIPPIATELVVVQPVTVAVPPEPIVIEVEPATVVSTDAAIHTIKDGETFSSIAGDYYDDKNQYWVIEKANPTVDPNRLKIGSKITIPEL